MVTFFYAACLLLAVGCTAVEYKRVCYYPNWTQYRPGDGKFLPEHIDGSLCTHINYAFAKMSNNRLQPYEWNDDSSPWSKGMYERVNAMKRKYPGLKTMLSVGGWNFGTNQVTIMLRTEESRRQFAATSIVFLRDRNFDGLDLDFEYPGSRGSPASDKQKYTQLVKQLKSAFDYEARSSGKSRLLLTAAVAAGESNIKNGYEIREISKYFDFINLMAYDLHGNWETTTGFNAPLFGRSGESIEDSKRNVAWAANYWIKEGCPRRKLVIGMATYGRSFRLADSAINGVGARKAGKPTAGQYTREPGFLAYYEICQVFMGENKDNLKWDDEHKVPYAYKGNMWVGYDNEYSLQLKVEWMMGENLGGWMVWDLASDDFTGKFCHAGKYPLLRRLNKALKGEAISMRLQGRSSGMKVEAGFCWLLLATAGCCWMLVAAIQMSQE